MKLISKNKYFNITYGILLNLIFLIVCLIFVEQQYDMPDTSQYPVFISNGYYTFGFLNYFFCVICGALEVLIYPINAYLVLQVVFSFFALTAISVVFLQKYNLSAATFAIALLNSCYSIFQYTSISFTIYPALLGVAGILCIIHFSRREKWLLGVSIGIILMLLNVLFRIAVTEAVLIIGIFYVIGLSLAEFFAISKTKRKIKDFFLILFEKKRFLSFFVAVILCFSCHFVSNAINRSTPELKYYREYTNARSEVWDYDIPTYDVCPEKYDALGLSANDIELFRKGYMDDEGATPLSVLKGIRQIQQEYNAEHRSIIQVFQGMLAAIPVNIQGRIEPIMGYFSFGLTILLMLIFMKKRRLFIPLLIGTAMFILLFYLYYIGRTPYRTVHMIWVSSLVYMLYSFSFEELKEPFKRIYVCRRKIAVVCTLIVSLVFSPIVFYVSKITRFTLTTYSSVDNTKNLRKYISENKNSKFVFSRTSGLASVEDNVHYIVKSDLKNTAGFTATYYRYDACEAELEQFGYHNLYKSLLEKNVYLVDSNSSPDVEKLQEYLQKFYANGYKITYQRIASFDGQSVYLFEYI